MYFDKYKKYKNKYIDLKTHGGGGGNNAMKKNTDHTVTVSEPWFSLISLGQKTVEGRLNKGLFAKMKKDETVTWTNSDFGFRSVVTKIVKKVQYKSFEEYLTAEGLEKCLPAIPDIHMGTKVYYKYYTKDKENKFGVCAIHLAVID